MADKLPETEEELKAYLAGNGSLTRLVLGHKDCGACNELDDLISQANADHKERVRGNT